ncbi:hypothetical protein VPH46_11780 [Sphingomonas sp. MJ1 (PH-R8)]|uniref:hypothetical protein n=1 Tax=Sphingomonas sp. MJ1 (PH-R8) TaxID=3112950 RepID=UPI003A89080B
MNRAAWLAGAGLLVLTTTDPAQAQGRRVEVSPYIEVGQVLSADLTNDDVLTYTQLTAGVDAVVQSRRVQVQLSYQYQRTIGWGDDARDSDVHSGLARANAQLTRTISLEAGALATRTRAGIGGGSPAYLAGYDGSSTQVYSLYGGPTLSTRAGPVAVNAAYRLGYTKVEAPDLFRDETGRELDFYDDSTSHQLTGSLSTRPGTLLPVGLTLAGGLVREDTSQLDQFYEGKFLRLDALMPVSRELAVVGGIGWEKIEVGQRDPLLDAQGFPVVDGNGRYVTDPDSPIRLAYDVDGVIWDAGVVWHPSPRFQLEARIGQRYGSMIYTGSLTWQTAPNAGLQVRVYDTVTTFGQQLTSGLASLPTSFYNGGADPFGNRYSGCVFSGGTTPGGVPQPGTCLTPVFQSISTAVYRARGVDAVYAVSRGNTRLGVGAGYSNRHYFLPEVPGADIYRSNDESYYAQAFAQRALDSRSGVTADLYANYFTSGIDGALDSWGGGAQGAYYRNFGRAYGTFSAGLYTFDVERSESAWIAQALLAFGYRF